MIAITFPPPDFKIIREGNKELIFDRLRKRYITLTPEEWVRQNFINYLVKVLSYPSSLIGIEREIYIGEVKKRFDIVVFNREMRPWMLIECKEMNVPLTEKTLQQVVQYNMVMPSAYLVITNGSYTFCGSCEGGNWRLLHKLPVYPG